MIKIITDSPVATESPDFLAQQEDNLEISFSAAEDNSTNKNFIEKISNYIGEKNFFDIYEKKINVLDLGCGGGQLITDFSHEPFTNICIGLDGIAGTLDRPNWKNKNLFFNVDLSKNYSIVDEFGELIKFDLITSWEMIEHLHPSDLETFFKNMIKHLKDDGIFVGSIALFPDIRDEKGYHQDHPSFNPSGKQFVLHQSVFSEEKWRKDILKDYKVIKYPLEDSSYACGFLAVRDHPKDKNGNGGSYYLMIIK